ncbi:hypothetical protein H311_00030 [Anncaliia algerae PRA109]|nr:hypothetical protein H311_00030 [Anncaliia algerae PRA109]
MEERVENNTIETEEFSYYSTIKLKLLNIFKELLSSHRIVDIFILTYSFYLYNSTKNYIYLYLIALSLQFLFRFDTCLHKISCVIKTFQTPKFIALVELLIILLMKYYNYHIFLILDKILVEIEDNKYGIYFIKHKINIVFTMNLFISILIYMVNRELILRAQSIIYASYFVIIKDGLKFLFIYFFPKAKYFLIIFYFLGRKEKIIHENVFYMNNLRDNQNIFTFMFYNFIVFMTYEYILFYIIYNDVVDNISSEINNII